MNVELMVAARKARRHQRTAWQPPRDPKGPKK
ncbi:hypothetical protein SEA_NICOLETERA_90 [Mycobacterium phage NicoleTera]|nr:hypothetical protein SEA_NICOLETERA_90 [Mycobacterium phage NicoleTera]